MATSLLARAAPGARPARVRRRRLLLVGGSLNQTTLLHRVARELPEHECVFTPFYADGLLGRAAARGWLDFTILGGAARRQTEAFLLNRGLPVDFGGRNGGYDLVLAATDLALPANWKGRPLVLVQEGMTDPEDWRYRAVRAFGLPRYLANTSMTGLSGSFAAFCVASEGYRALFRRKGVPDEKMVVTGLPNFDDAASYRANDFPHHGYVLGATSCLRETFKWEDRPAFIRRCLDVADGRELIFKLHPNENAARAEREIHRHAPGALVFARGDTNHMIANAAALVTRYSSVVYVALALGLEVHADLPLETLRRLQPVQNGGRSARHIADVCRRLLS
jgi:hypothetical protein